MLRTIFTGFLYCASAPLAMAQDEPSPRLFDTILVEGNDRFSDRDILATADLPVGQPMTRRDLENAVEALDFTGEFKDIAINSDGSTLIITVREQPEYSGDLTFGLGYDSDSGVIGIVGLSLTDVITTGTDVNSTLAVAQEYRTGDFEITSDTLIGNGHIAGLRLTYSSYDYDNTLFGYDQLSFGPFVQFSLSDATNLELRYSVVRDDLRDVTTGASSILVAEEGERNSSVLGATISTSGLVDTVELQWSAELSLDFAGLGSDDRFTRAAGKVNASIPVAQSGFSLRTALEFGTIQNTSGAGARATDRFTLGGAEMRGFERGTISVRDENGAVSTSLGGENYAVARTDLVLPVFQETQGLDAFLFADIGNVWGLETSGGADGVVDVDGKWRTSTGAGVSLSTDLGRFEAFYAVKTDASSSDTEQAVGLTFRVSF